MRSSTWLLALASLFLVLPGAAPAQGAFPEREIRVLTGFPAGGAAEVTLRALVQAAQKHVGKPLVIVNRPGAAQVIAMSELAAAPADGYTIGMSTDSFPSLTAAQNRLRFDPDDLRVLLGYAQFHHVLFVKGDSPLRRYDAFAAAARQQSGGLSYGVPGTGSAPDLLGRLFARGAQVPLTSVSYKGSNEYVANVLGGQLASAIVTTNGIHQQLRDGSLAAVVSFGKERLADFPDVPTAREKGVKEDLGIFDSVLTIVASRNVPADRAALLHDAFREAVDDPEFRRAMAASGLQAAYFAPAAVQKRIDDARRIGVPLLRELGLLAAQEQK